MYHSHHDEKTQIGRGMTGLFVIHPRKRPDPTIDRDFAIMLHEWRRGDVRTSRPNPNEMTDFNVLTFNGRSFPGTEPLVAKAVDRIRIRIGNVNAMDHHPIHLHGHIFKIVESDGGQIPPSAQWPETTVLELDCSSWTCKPSTPGLNGAGDARARFPTPFAADYGDLARRNVGVVLAALPYRLRSYDRSSFACSCGPCLRGSREGRVRTP